MLSSDESDCRAKTKPGRTASMRYSTCQTARQSKAFVKDISSDTVYQSGPASSDRNCHLLFVADYKKVGECASEGDSSRLV